jgi:hypothetical protein
MVWVLLHGVFDFPRYGLLRCICEALIHVLLCLKVDGTIFGAIIYVTAMIHIVRGPNCVWASAMAAASVAGLPLWLYLLNLWSEVLSCSRCEDVMLFSHLFGCPPPLGSMLCTGLG